MGIPPRYPPHELVDHFPFLSNILRLGALLARMKMYCSSCFREEPHKYVRLPKYVRGTFLILTLGLGYFILPKRCTCCGKVRYL